MCIATGGTGGHIFPGIALAEVAEGKGWECMFITDKKGRKFLKDYQFWVIETLPFFGTPLSSKLIASFKLLKAVNNTKVLLKYYKPDVLIGTGGYPMVPAVISSILQRIPLFILEENRVPGRATSLFAKFAKMVFYGFPPLSKAKGESYFSGNPLRKEMVKKREQYNPSKVLILGGSQGAATLNKIAFKLAQKFPKENFILIKGKWKLENKYIPSNLKIYEFIENLWDIYKHIKVAVSRAGGMAVTELIGFGIPTIFIPFAYAVDNHQYWNAKYIEEKGAGLMLLEKDIDKLEKLMGELLKNKSLRERIRKRALEIAEIDAGEKIIREINRCLAN